MFYSKTTGGFYTQEVSGDNTPADSVEITAEEHAALLAGQSEGKRIVADENGYPVMADPPTLSHAQLVQQFDQALTSYLDVTAQARRYDNRITCALRAGYTGPFQAEGQAFATWMDGCNALAYQWLAEIEAGTRPMFASTDEFISALPEMVWPAP